MSQAFAVRFAARDAESAISPQFAFVGKTRRSLDIGDKSASGDDADTGRGLQKANFREPVGCGNHRCFSLFKHIEHLIKHGEGLREHLPDGWFFEFIEQHGLTAFAKKPRVEANDTERS